MPKKPVAVSLRKPQAPADVEAFVAASSAQAIASAPPRDAVVQHGAREYREMTLYIPNELAKKLSFYCMDKNCDVNGVVAEAVKNHVAPEAAQALPAPRIRLDRDVIESLLERSRDRLASFWALRPWAI